MFLATEIFRIVSHEPFQADDLSELAFAAIGAVGLIVALHQPRNAIGWTDLTVWLGAAGVFAGLQEYAYWVEASHPGAPGGSVAAWLGTGRPGSDLRAAADLSLPPVPRRASAVAALASGRVGDRGSPARCGR